MSHKIYSVESHPDYMIDVTFFNGEVRRCNLKLLIECLHDSAAQAALLNNYSALFINHSKNAITVPSIPSIDSETLHGSGYIIEINALKDPVIALANNLIDIREAKHISQRELEAKSGVKQAEISKIERGEGNPSLKTMVRLYAAMNKKLVIGDEDSLRPKPWEIDHPPISESIVKALPEYKKQGTYTTKDVEALPDYCHVELIDGVIYDMCVPTLTHQIIVNSVHNAFHSYITANHGSCISLIGPTGVWFENDEQDLLIPDMLVVCDPSKLRDKGIVGAPDFVLEVQSPSTRFRDVAEKLLKYNVKGVKEYWVVDPAGEKVVVYNWAEKNSTSIYGFKDNIPVRIYDGKLEICIADFLQ